MLRKKKVPAEAPTTDDAQKSGKKKFKCPRAGGIVPDLNRRVVAFAINNLGRQVGNGECWTLAADALKYAGAQPPRRYVFGKVIPLEQAKPGDILQFTKARFETPTHWKVLGLPNHTAILYSTMGNKTFILHQNFGSKKVTTLDLDFRNQVSGTVVVYRPIPQ